VKGLQSHFQPLTPQRHHKQVTQHHLNLLNQLASHHLLNQPFHLPNQLHQYQEVHLYLPHTQVIHQASHQQRLTTLHQWPLTQGAAIQVMWYHLMGLLPPHPQYLPTLPVKHTLLLNSIQHLEANLLMVTLKFPQIHVWLTHLPHNH